LPSASAIKVDGQFQFGAIELRRSTFPWTPQPKAQRDAQWSPAVQQDHDVDRPDIALLGRTPQPFGPRQGRTRRCGDNHIINNPDRWPQDVAERACQRAQGGHQQGRQIVLAEPSRKLIVTRAGQIAAEPEQRGTVVDQNQASDIG